MGHSLVAITLQARAGLRRLSRNPERVGEALHEIEGLAAGALEETRSAIATIRSDTDARPSQQSPTLDDLPGLVRSRRAPDLEVDLTLAPAAHDLPTGMRSAAYQIVQESLSNVAKHARPAHTAVRLRREGDAFEIEITDDGTSATHALVGSGLRGGCGSGPNNTAAASKRAPHSAADGGSAPRFPSSTSRHDHVFGALRAGAAGFLLKDASPETLVDAIRAVARAGADRT